MSPYVGGRFGSKPGVTAEAVAAAISAKKLNRPVQIVIIRQQVFGLAHRGRKRASGSGWRAMGRVSCRASGLTCRCRTCRAAHRQILHAVARIHRGCAGSVRAPDKAVGVTVFECAMDGLAEAAGMTQWICACATSRARVTLTQDGHAIVETDMTDIGSGTCTIPGQIVAEMLGLPNREGRRFGCTTRPSPCCES